MVVAWAAAPHSLSGSVMGEFWSLLAKVQPSLVLMVAAVDIPLVLGRQFLWVFFVELADEIG